MTDRVTWAYFSAASLIWGSSFLFTKVALAEVPPFSMVTYRIGLGAAVLLLWGWTKRMPLRVSRRDLALVIGVGLFNVAGSFSLITSAQETLSSSQTSVLVSALPLVSSALSAFTLPNESFTPRRLVGLVLGFSGVVLVFSKGLIGEGVGSPGAPFAAVLVMVGLVMIAGSAIAVKRWLQHLTPTQVIVYQLLASVPVTLYLAYGFESTGSLQIPLPRSPEVWGSVIFLGIFGAGVANIFFYRLITAWGVPRTTLISYAIPVIGVFLGVILLGEPLTVRLLVGTFLILSSISLVSSRRTKDTSMIASTRYRTHRARNR